MPIQPLRSITWTEIFAHWRASEATNPAWIHTATIVKGWPDWESWRMFVADQLGLPQRRWQLCTVADPMNEIPAMLVGPFSGWQARFPRPNIHTFADLVRIPAQYSFFSTHAGVKNIIANFPSHTMFTGLRRMDGRIVVIEGHHRATALALAQREQVPLIFPSPITFALADLVHEDADLLDRVLARGTTKQPPTK